MDDAWEVLAAHGVPVGPVRPTPRGPTDGAALRAAVCAVAAALDADPNALTTREADPLLAWLRAMRHHFAPAYARLLGAEGDALIERLEARDVDPNRYLKLRRIAIANLAGLV